MPGAHPVETMSHAPVETNGSGKVPHRGSIQSVDRALSLLEALAELGGEATLTELSRRTSLNVSTGHHLLSTLVSWGYVVKVPGRRSYALGTRVLHLSHACLRQIDLPQRAQTQMRRISEMTGDIVVLDMLRGDTIITVATRAARTELSPDRMMDREAPHVLAAAKAIMAWLPGDRARRIIASPRMKRLSGLELDAVTDELNDIRRLGYAMEGEPLQAHAVAISAAIRDDAGAVIGAISVAAPAMRASCDHIDVMRQEVTAAAHALSIGVSPSDPPLAEAGESHLVPRDEGSFQAIVS